MNTALSIVTSPIKDMLLPSTTAEEEEVEEEVEEEEEEALSWSEL
jgi:hypothetical protein